MTYYLFPKAFIRVFTEPEPCAEYEDLSPSLRYYLSNVLLQLQNVNSDPVEHFANTYYSLFTNQEDSLPISKLNISGSNFTFYYELLELFQTVHLSMDMYHPIRIFLIGEGEMNINAFQSIQRIRHSSVRDKYFMFESEELRLLKEAPNMTICPIDTGYYTIANFLKCISNHESSIEFIISDAILPFVPKTDYIKEYEYQTTRIAMLQVCFALCMQKKNGVFILKLGDCFSPLTMDLVCILSSFYNKTYFTKPTVSDSSSSCRFMVCKGFIYDDIKAHYSFFTKLFKKVLSTGIFGSGDVYLHRFIQWNVPKLFTIKMEEMNSIFGQPQLEQLQHVHSVLTHKYKIDKTNNFIKNNIQKCIQWCIKHKIPFRNL